MLQKLSQVESGKSLAREKLEFLLSHLPFVVKTGEDGYSAMNLKTIAPSTQGGAQCFLVIEECTLEETQASDGPGNKPEGGASTEMILDFVNTLPYASKVKVL